MTNVDRIERLRQLIRAAKQEGGLSYKRIAQELSVEPEAVRNFVRGKSRNPSGVLLINFETLVHKADSLIYKFANKSQYNFLLQEEKNYKRVDNSGGYFKERENNTCKTNGIDKLDIFMGSFWMIHKSFDKREGFNMEVCSFQKKDEFDEMIEEENYTGNQRVSLIESGNGNIYCSFFRNENYFNIIIERAHECDNRKLEGIFLKYTVAEGEVLRASRVLFVPTEQGREWPKKSGVYYKHDGWLREDEIYSLERKVPIVECNWLIK